MFCRNWFSESIANTGGINKIAAKTNPAITKKIIFFLNENIDNRNYLK